MLDELKPGPLTTGPVDRIGAGRHLVLQHLSVLRDADLIITETRGRHRLNYLNPVPIRLIYERWLSGYEGVSAEALVGLRQEVESRRLEDHVG